VKGMDGITHRLIITVQGLGYLQGLFTARTG